MVFSTLMLKHQALNPFCFSALWKLNRSYSTMNGKLPCLKTFIILKMFGFNLPKIFICLFSQARWLFFEVFVLQKNRSRFYQNVVNINISLHLETAKIFRLRQNIRFFFFLPWLTWKRILQQLSKGEAQEKLLTCVKISDITVYWWVCTHLYF